MSEASISLPHLDLGAGIGRIQGFGLVGAQCSAAQALAMRQIRDSESYKSTGLNWEDFCPTHFGLTRRRVDGLIATLDEFGETYFHLCEVVRISPETFRRIASRIHDGQIEIQGAMVPIGAENAPRIRQAVAAVQNSEKPPRSSIIKPGRLDNAVLCHFRKRILGWTTDVKFLFHSLQSEDHRAGLLQMVEQQMLYLGEELREMSRQKLPENRK